MNIAIVPNREKKSRTTIARVAALVLALLVLCLSGSAQNKGDQGTDRSDPEEIRGYKVAHASVSVKRQSDLAAATKTDSDPDALVQVGEPHLVSVRPFGITFEVPVTVAALEQGGSVDFLSFEDVKVNGSSVTIEDFEEKFAIPNKKPTDLPASIRVFISTPTAMLGALNEWRNSQETWPVSGRVYVFGHFKKFIFKVKRVVPIDFNLSISNPLRGAPDDSTKPTNGSIKTN